MALKTIQVQKASPKAKPYKLADGEGLFLLVKPNGSKLWQMKYRFGGKEKLLSFGAYPQTTLAAAREQRRIAKQALAQGQDPMAGRARNTTEDAMSFKRIPADAVRRSTPPCVATPCRRYFHAGNTIRCDPAQQ